MMKLTFTWTETVFRAPALLLGQGRRTKHVALQRPFFIFIFVPLLNPVEIGLGSRGVLLVWLNMPRRSTRIHFVPWGHIDCGCNQPC